LQVSSCCTQTSGELVTVTGTEQQTALRVVDGDVEYGGTDSNDTFSSVMKVTNTLSSAPSTRVSITNSSDTDGPTLLELNQHGTAGNALVITNTATQSSGNLVQITGESGQTALHVTTGNTELNDTLVVTGETILTDTLEVTGDTTLNNTVVDGELQVNGTIVLPNTSPPTTSIDAGVAGEIRYDATYLYICTAANTWHRTPLSTW